MVFWLNLINVNIRIYIYIIYIFIASYCSTLYIILNYNTVVSSNITLYYCNINWFVYIYICINSDIKCMYIPIYVYITVLHCPTCCKGFLWFLPNCLCTASPCRTLDSYPCPLENLPVFVRAGAIIPMWPQLDYVGQKTVDVLTKP